ncbi:MAG: rRNA pseudouridine synthase [Alicyclobacillus macrosporangiidus]|uniref:pseudouridine synthase n=1 Tax=Alicyclobacillus macrosporangiidus TaxID=392015 RepID=UPI0026EC7CCD|nr:pseudouridine synthase [Alicyclobacillus macrosporangiidus]MCL6598001.1 rRNA pseudouridine synthase [Alicyclobacillus macrosporangiidus]
MEERLQKVLARAGVASRRQCETLIREGRVTVDGVVVTELGTKVDPLLQQIAVDGRVVSLERPVCVMLHKPTSYVTTVRDPQGRRTVMDLVADVGVRLYPVGRLDYDSSGLLLLSNDGDLTYRLLHPSRHVDKTYRVTVLGIPEKEGLQRLRRGIELEDGPAQPAQVKVLRQHPLESVLEITIHEGRHRQVRRMMEAIGCPVKRLKRVSFGPLALGDLPPGQWRMLTPEEWQALYTSVDLPVPPYPGEETDAADRRDRPRTLRRKPESRKGRKS